MPEKRWDVPKAAGVQIMLADRDVAEKVAEVAHKQEELRMARAHWQRLLNAVAGALGIEGEVQLSDDGAYFFVPEAEVPAMSTNVDTPPENGHKSEESPEIVGASSI